MFFSTSRIGFLALAALIGLASGPSVMARTVVSVGIGVGPGWYGPPPGYRYVEPVPAPVYVAPPPAYVVTPPPVVQVPAPATWLYCGNPAGYYPYVQACSMPWQQVPAVAVPPAVR